MKNTVVRYGIYGSITICILFTLALTLGKNLSYSLQEVIGYASMVVSLIFVYFGIKHYRDTENNGAVSFGKALIIGLLISLFAAIAFGLLDVIYIKYINPDFSAEYYGHIIEEMRTTLSEEEFKIKLSELETQKELFSSPLMNFLLMSATVLIIGFIISLISGLILQRKPSQ
ncbi:DUF4199 domain-containing protein [Aquimarina sp. MMG015]|uniref:DUF4199 domain-containing protein n=1 Tax=unclassified Aquimarina TaxID=2627091 RepID=UPI000E47F829|nr:MULTISPECIES: DUF4199 domain-containing protein [unclassified Aquimarina]AXT57627.1 DUF4199 domain-containing protein [Aquimarina sp. AD1]MBQ4805151.1 DUF4199 domain-containing protein [Aquimarina sp. MMG015]RKN28286.1 DUF4199 family protein [Aquimarina sp. AD1]